MAGANDDVRLPFSVLDQAMGDVLSVLWEPEMMGETGNILKILTSEVLTQVGQQVLQATVLTALMSALQWPIMLTKLGYLIDNPWSNALDRAKQAGAVLADVLIKRHVGVRPVSLIGFSLGARAIFYALMELAKRKAYGIVQEVYLLGATVTASNRVWREIRGVVAGRFVNGYCKKDWILGYLYRATTGGLMTVAGLSPVEYVPDLENVDLTDVLVGHMSYRPQMPVLLQKLGFRVTADHFDEPDELMEEQPEGAVEEAQRVVGDLEDKQRKAWKLFRSPPRKNSATPKSGASTRARPSLDSTASTGSATTAETKAGNEKSAEYDEYEDDEPPRLEHPHLANAAGRATSPAPPSQPHSPQPPTTPSMASETFHSADGGHSDEAEPDTFDIAAIKAEIAQMNASPAPASAPRPPPPTSALRSPRMSTEMGDGKDDLRRKWLGRPDPTPPPQSPPDDVLDSWGSSLPSPAAEDTPPTPVVASVYSFTAPTPSWSSDPSPPAACYEKPGLAPSPFDFGARPSFEQSQISFGGENGEIDLPHQTMAVDEEDGWAPMRTAPWSGKKRTGSGSTTATSGWREDPWKA